MQGTKSLLVLVSVAILIASSCTAHAGPVRITCRDGGSRVFYDFDGRQSSERGVCDRDAVCDGVCTFDFSPECVACNLSGKVSAECPCYALDSPCNERFLVPVGPRRRMGRLIRKFQQSYTMTFILRCRPARKRCKNTATNVTTTTVPGELAVEGIWTFTTTGLEDSCPAATTSPIDTSIRIARYGSHLLGCGAAFHGEEWEGTSSSTDFTLALNNTCCDVGCKGGDGTYTTYHVAGTLHGTSTSAGADTLSLTQEWILSPLGNASCPPCRMTWTGTMTRVPASP